MNVVKYVNAINRVSTILILAVVSSVMLYAYYSLMSGETAGAMVNDDYRWSEQYQAIATAGDGEVFSVLAYVAQPDSATARKVTAGERMFDRVVSQLRARAVAPADRSTLGEIMVAHAACVSAIQRVGRLFNAGREADGNAVYHHDVVPAYAKLNDLVNGAAQRHYAAARALDTKVDALDKKLRWTMAGVGLLGFVVLGGLLFTMRVYKLRAEHATKREMRRLEEAALSDSLTSLGNHRAFYEDFAREIARSRRHGHAMTLAIVDVDDFKSLNDTRGHQYGDEILVRIGQAMGSGRQEDRAYRIGGDEFALLLPESDRGQAQAALERIHRVTAQTLDGLTVSMGFCELGAQYDEHDLYERADAALYAAKRNGRNAIVDFETIRTSTTIFSSRKTAALRKLIERRALDVAFQPIWNLDGKGILGFEALARPDPELGFSGPQEAFDVAERVRKVVELDRVCIGKILSAASKLPGDELLFINVAPETLTRSDFRASELTQAVEKAGLKPTQIVIEVTERRISDVAGLVRHASDLRNLGVRLALDDTGAGYAGLEILSKFTFDFVKIDRGVTADAIEHKRARGILAGIIAIAREGGSFVIAEGIESVEQLEFLRDLPDLPKQSFAGVRGAQGYLLGRPRCGAPNAAEFLPYGHILDCRIDLAS
jgi:diguanylate cyclase (GGDEF)-like protein